MFEDLRKHVEEAHRQAQIDKAKREVILTIQVPEALANDFYEHSDESAESRLSDAHKAYRLFEFFIKHSLIDRDQARMQHDGIHLNVDNVMSPRVELFRRPPARSPTFGFWTMRL